MIKLLVAVDEEDGDLGVYFGDCKNDLLLFIGGQAGIEVIEIPSKDCRATYLDIALAHLNDLPILFVGYTHGNENNLIVKGDNFVGTGLPNPLLKKAFFYSNSCSCGQNLGSHLLSKGCLIFIGYKNKVEKLTAPHNKAISIKCDNQGMKAFLSQKITAHEAFQQMFQLYTQEIAKLKRLGDPLSAAVLINSRESMAFLGDEGLRLDDFFVRNG